MPKKKKVEQYAHTDKTRANNPPVGLVTPQTDPDADKKKTWAYDPHIDPALHWAGKAEHTSFDVSTVSLHVHERIESRTIIEAVKKRNGDANGRQQSLSLFASPEENPPLREAVEFYKHRHNWSNRLVAGDSLLVMNSLLEKEGMAGKVQCVYMDPPYGIKYGSNFQPFVNKRDVKDGKDEDLTQEPEMIRAFRDTWELGIHSYLSYLRDRLLLARELLSESGSCFVQIGDENVHYTKAVIEEIFGANNCCGIIAFQKTGGFAPKLLSQVYDYLVWFAKDKEKVKYRNLFRYRTQRMIDSGYSWLELPDGQRRRLSQDEIRNPQVIPNGAKRFQTSILVSAGASETGSKPFKFEKDTYYPAPGTHWKTSHSGLDQLAKSKRLMGVKNTLTYVRYEDDFPLIEFNNVWDDTVRSTYASQKLYVVQTAEKVVQRCLLMTTDPGDLVFDPTCGSGTTALVAEQWGRRWITCDTSRVSVTLAKQRLMTAGFDYYKLAHPDEGVGSGFQYKTVPHVTLKSIAHDEPPATETLYDQPLKDTKKARVTGPFTVEAVPAPMVKSISDTLTKSDADADADPAPADHSIVRSGETLRQEEWRDELEKAGVRGKGGQRIMFSRVELFPGRHLHAEAETRPDDSGINQARESSPTAYRPQHAVICFGPEHAPLEQRQVESALDEAGTLREPKPTIIIFAAFQFDPEAAKDIDETNWPGMTLLKVQMNADLQTEDLRKKQRNSDSFWLVGQPDVELYQIRKGENAGKWRAEVRGFDYFDTRSGQLMSGGEDQIAMWMLDPDYDGRSLYPNQVFFPMAGPKDGWSKLARSLRAEIDEDLIEVYHGVESLPFEAGEHRRVAVKIVDDRGVESLRVITI